MQETENSIKKNPKKIFDFIRIKQGYARIPGSMFKNDVCYDTPLEIVNAFADHFSSIYLQNTSVSEDLASYCPPFNLQMVTEQHILDILSSLPNNNTAGDDHIPSFLLPDMC